MTEQLLPNGPWKRRAADVARGRLSVGGLIFAAVGVALVFRADIFTTTVCDCHGVYLGVGVIGVGLSMLDPYMLLRTWRGKNRNGEGKP